MEHLTAQHSIDRVYSLTKHDRDKHSSLFSDEQTEFYSIDTSLKGTLHSGFENSDELTQLFMKVWP